MFLISAIIGGIIGWAGTSSVIGVVLGAVIAAVAVFALQAAIGLASVQSAAKAVPIDLGAPTPDPLTAEAYMSLPLAARNATVARFVANVAGRPVEHVVSLLAGMMGREKMSNLASQRASEAVIGEMDPSRIPKPDYAAVCDGEVRLAARSSLPPNDRIRAIVEQNLGGAVDEATMVQAVVTTRLPRIGRSIGELIEDALDGKVDLAFVVGSIRKVGEHHAREMAKIR